jgi:hypothetical protein
MGVLRKKSQAELRIDGWMKQRLDGSGMRKGDTLIG